MVAWCLRLASRSRIEGGEGRRGNGGCRKSEVWSLLAAALSHCFGEFVDRVACVTSYREVMYAHRALTIISQLHSAVLTQVQKKFKRTCRGLQITTPEPTASKSTEHGQWLSPRQSSFPELPLFKLTDSSTEIEQLATKRCKRVTPVKKKRRNKQTSTMATQTDSSIHRSP